MLKSASLRYNTRFSIDLRIFVTLSMFGFWIELYWIQLQRDFPSNKESGRGVYCPLSHLTYTENTKWEGRYTVKKNEWNFTQISLNTFSISVHTRLSEISTLQNRVNLQFSEWKALSVFTQSRLDERLLFYSLLFTLSRILIDFDNLFTLKWVNSLSVEFKTPFIEWLLLKFVLHLTRLVLISEY